MWNTVKHAADSVVGWHKSLGEVVDQTLDHHWDKWGKTLAADALVDVAGGAIGNAVYRAGMGGRSFRNFPMQGHFYGGIGRSVGRSFGRSVRYANRKPYVPQRRFPRSFRVRAHFFDRQASGSRAIFYAPRDSWKRGFRDSY